MRLSATEARRRFAASPRAILASVRPDGRPHLVPIVFALVGDTVYSAVDHKPKASVRLQRLENLRHEPRCSLLVDHYDDDWGRLWWVRADGTAEVLDTGTDTGGTPHSGMHDAGAHRANTQNGGTIDADVHPFGTHDGGRCDRAGMEALVRRHPSYRKHPPQGPQLRIRISRWRGWAAA